MAMKIREFWTNFSETVTLSLNKKQLLLSKAILDGCKIHKKQNFGALFEGNSEISSCALGAAFVGAGGKVREEVIFLNEEENRVHVEPKWNPKEYKKIFKKFDAYGAIAFLFKGAKEVAVNVLEKIPNLNDDCKWTRERIAHLIQNIEKNLMSAKPLIPFSRCIEENLYSSEKDLKDKFRMHNNYLRKGDLVHMKLNKKNTVVKIEKVIPSSDGILVSIVK